MSQKEVLKLFEERNVRVVWDEETEKWYFSVVDVCGVLTDQPDYDLGRRLFAFERMGIDKSIILTQL